MRRTFALIALGFSLHAGVAEAKPKIEKLTVVSAGRERPYYLYVPERAAGSAPMPLVVTLHGSGHDGKSLVRKWRGLAEKEGIVLAGPDATDRELWNIDADGPRFLHDLVEKLRSKLPIDGRRIYLFGHSAGAVFALEMASLESEYFAAVAVHAGALESQYHNVFLYARRKTPIFMVVGTKDVFFLQPTVRGTRDALAARGFPVELVEIYNHTHDYYGRSGEINAMAWTFLSRHALPGEPKYTEYAR